MNKPTLISLVMAAAVTSVLLISCKKNQFGDQDWSHFVTKDSAVVWVARYDAKHEDSVGRADVRNLRLLSYADDFNKGKWMMGSMMARKDVVGFRIYYGIKANGNIVPILVGLDKKGNDVYWQQKKPKSPVTAGGADEYTDGAMDMSQKSPPPPTEAKMLIPADTLVKR